MTQWLYGAYLMKLVRWTTIYRCLHSKYLLFVETIEWGCGGSQSYDNFDKVLVDCNLSFAPVFHACVRFKTATVPEVNRMYNHQQLNQPAGNGRCFWCYDCLYTQVFVLNFTRCIDILGISFFFFTTAEAIWANSLIILLNSSWEWIVYNNAKICPYLIPQCIQNGL